MHRVRYVVAIVCVVLGLTARLAAQTATIRGTVTDSASREALQGASVTLVGTGIRSETNASGQYTLSEAPAGTATVRVQMIGYAPVERRVTVVAGIEATLDVALSASAQRLEEVVAVGYGSQTRGELSTSVTSVYAGDIANQPVASLDAALQGKAAGVQVTQNAGNPGNAISVRVRGDASISASNQPLFVIDGVPMVVRATSPSSTWAARAIAAISGISPRRHRQHRRPQGRRRGIHLRLPGLQRRGDDHHEARPGGQAAVTFNSYVGTQSHRPAARPAQRDRST